MREVSVIKFVAVALIFILSADSYSIYNVPRSTINKVIGKHTSEFGTLNSYLQSTSNPTIVKESLSRKESEIIRSKFILSPVMTFFRIRQISFMKLKMRLFSSLQQMTMETIIAELKREIAVLLYAPIERKVVVLFHQAVALLSIHLLSLLITILSAAVIKTGLAAAALVHGVNNSIVDMRNKGIERTKVLKRLRDEEAANIALQKKQAEERFVTSELAKRLVAVKALKEEEERLATMSVKIKNEEQARIAILESAKREKVTRVLVEQANLRQLEQQRVDSEKKLQQEIETKLRIIAVQGKKNEKQEPCH